MHQANGIHSTKNLPVIIFSTLVFLTFMVLPFFTHALTISEAIKRALQVSFVIKEQKGAIESARFSYLASIDPYLPSLSLETSYQRRLTVASVETLRTYTGDSRDIYNFSLRIDYRIFDGGQRESKRKMAYTLLEEERDSLRLLEEDVIYKTKNAFWGALSKKSIIEKRKEAYEATKKVYRLTCERYNEGVAKKIDVIQAEVNMIQAEIELEEAKKEYEKALEVLKSLLQMEEIEKIEGPEDEPTLLLEKEELLRRASSERPDILRQKKEIEKLTYSYQEKKSAFYPKVDIELYEARQDKRFFPEGASRSLFLTLSFPIFDGIGRYYNLKKVSADIESAKNRLYELERSAKQEVTQALIDFNLSIEKVKMYRALLTQAEANFSQALEEYRVGKGDILTLLQSERNLAKAKEGLVDSIYNAHISLAYLQKVASLKD